VDAWYSTCEPVPTVDLTVVYNEGAW
jgi:hypothetical protein